MNRSAEILEKIKQVEKLPAAAVEVLRLVRDPDVDFKDLAKAIEYDPGLTTNVLKFANSAYFGGSGSVKTVRNALVRMGTNEISTMVMASAAGPLVSGAVKGYDLESGRLWHHSVAVAVGSRILADELGVKAPDHTFTAGLLHDVGKIVLGTFVDIEVAEITELAFSGDVSFEEAERAVLGIDHAEVGAHLLESWNLPAEIVEVARYHHTPDYSDREDVVIDLVHIADALSISTGVGAGTDGLNYRLSEPVCTKYELTVTKMENVISKMLGTMSELPDMFDVDKSGRR